MASEQIAVALVENREVSGAIRYYPEDGSGIEGLLGTPAETIVRGLVEEIRKAAGGRSIDAIGIGVPGVVRDGIIEEAPNLPQVKGLNLEMELLQAFRSEAGFVPVLILNNADALAAGVAVTQGFRDRFVRVWTLGRGVGYGRYPRRDGIWEGGHSIVSLDPKERYCRCGGAGHLEGIVGNRAMRLRFLDLEPEEVFENAEAGDARCRDFVRYWHRAIAAATATAIHMDGPGRFFISGSSAKYVDTNLLAQYLAEMVTIGALGGSKMEVMPASDAMAVIGAAVSAEMSALGV
jgi:predicted NBD/HSP70 family sugar kinase